MRLNLFLILIAVISGLAVFGYFKAVPGAVDKKNLAKIEITPQSYDFGEVNYGTIIKYNFEVKNSGQEILEIKRVGTSCSCTTAKISKETIVPGQVAELQVSYDTGAMGLAHGKGKQERIIYVKSSDPKNPQAQVIIYAFVK